MATQDIGSETVATERSGIEIRAELYRIIEELGSARDDQARALRVRFDALWDELRANEGQETVH